MKKSLLMVVLVALVATVNAQKIGATAPKTVTNQPKVAFMPLMFQENDKGVREYVNSAREPYEKALYGTFEKMGIARIDQAIVNNAWRKVKDEVFNTALFELPDPANLVKLGQDLGVDYVVVSRCHWLVRSPWVGLGPKTKAHATVDLWIIEVPKSEFALKADQVKSDSTEKAPDWRLAVDLFLAPISAFSGGPKTNHEIKSGVLSLGKAIQPWLEKMQTTSKIRIGG